MLMRIAAPATALDLADAKLQVRIADEEHEYDDDLNSLIRDVQSIAESELCCGITDTRYREVLSGFPGGAWALRRGRVKTVEAVTYFDRGGQQQTLTGYRLAESGGVAVLTPDTGRFPETASRLDAVTIDYVSGFGGSEDVPDGVKRWMKLQIGNWFANREAAGERVLVVNPFVDALIAEYRIRMYL